MRTRALPLLILTTLLFLLPGGLLHAQETCPLAPRLTIGMPGRVRAVNTAGNNLRANAGIEAELTGYLENDTEFVVESGPNCKDGINWYRVRALDGTNGWTAESAFGNYWLEPIPFCTPQQRAANTGYLLTEDTAPFYRRLTSVRYDPARKSLLLASQPHTAVETIHPALWTYQWLNLETQALTPAEYPDADIVTPELTDKLGITEYVFGEHSRAFYSLHVSPNRARILYFTYNPPIKDCAHGCYTAQVWVADVDGSNAKEVGRMVMGDAGYIAWEWGGGKIYLTMVYLDLSYGVIEICDDGSCFNTPDESFPYNYAYPSVSPDGEHIVFVRTFGSDFDDLHNQLYEQKSRSWFALPLDGWHAPALWSDDGQTIYYAARVKDRVALAAVPLDDLTRADILVDDVIIDYNASWDVAPDLDITFSAADYYGLNIYCMRQSEE
jgi:hypothetical protein